MSAQPTSIYRSARGAQAVESRYRELLARWPVPNQQLRIPTRAGATFVIVSGPEQAPALLLFHGSGFNSVSWMGDVAAWAAHFRVHAVDVIGHPGLSAPSRPPYETGDHAQWIEDVMRGLGIERAALVGISLGGWLAIDFATRHPEQASALVLLAPGGVGRELMTTARLLLTVLPLMFLGDRGRRRAMARMLGPVRVRDAAGLQTVNEFTTLINRYYRQRTDRLARFSDDALRRLVMPVQLIVGTQDPMLDSAETRRRLESTVTDLEVLELPDVGHMVVDQTAPILAFLQRRIRGPSA
jgi:pimeloyl-ACP methyl ester carboxylesterase